MTLNEDPIHLLNEWVPNERLQLHMKQVRELMMKDGPEKEQAVRKTAWKGTSRTPSCADGKNILDDHGRIIIEGPWTPEPSTPEVSPRIWPAHDRYFGVEPQSYGQVIYAVLNFPACYAAALIRPPGMKVLKLKAYSHVEDPFFATQVSREDITDALSRVAFTLKNWYSWQHWSYKGVTRKPRRKTIVTLFKPTALKPGHKKRFCVVARALKKHSVTKN